MQRRFQLACYVTDDLSAAFAGRARARNLTVAAALRQLVINDVVGAVYDPRELRNHILFMTIAMDGLLIEHPNRELRPRLIQEWQERVAREDQSHAA
jgi:hypothetical protein